MASYIGQTALTALWNKLVAVLSGKADRASVYSKAEVDYKLATTYGAGSSGNFVTTDTAQSISGLKTFTSTGNIFYSGGIKIRSSSSSTKYATLYNTGSSDKSVYMPTNSGNNYLLGRGSSNTTANTIPYYTNASGGMGAITLKTASSTGLMSDNDSEVPTSAAIIAYLLSKGVISSA